MYKKMNFIESKQSIAFKDGSAPVIGLKTLIIAISILALYSQDLIIIFNDALQNEAINYILAIPFIFIYLIYRKRKMLMVTIPFKTEKSLERYFSTLISILLCTASVILYWYGSYTFMPLEYHILTLPIFIVGLMLFLFNIQTFREAIFPIAFLLFLIPIPSETFYNLSFSLSVIGSEASNMIINAIGIPSTISSEYGNPIIFITRHNGETIGFMIDIACSGMYSLIGFIIFATFVTYIVRDKILKKIPIFLLGLPLIYSLNIIRITTILLIGYYYGEQLAMQIFHLIGGWTLIFLGTLLLLIIIENFFKTKIFVKAQSSACPKCNLNSNKDFCLYCGRLLKYPQAKFQKSDIVKIAAITFSIIILISIQAPVFALTEGPAQIIIQAPTGEQANTEILPQIPEYRLQFIYRDKEFEKIAKQNASLVYAYIPNDETKETVLITVEIASTRGSLHSWEGCYITWPQTHGYQPSVTQLDLKDVQILQNPPITARFFAFQYKNNNQTQVVLYWYETSTFKINNTTQQKYVKISLIAYLKNPKDVPAIEELLLPFAKTIANYWQPIKTWTSIALIISQNGLILIPIIVILIVIILAYQKFQDFKDKKATLKLYNKLSEENKLIIKAINQASKENKNTINEINLYYSKLIGKNIECEQLMKKLHEIEKSGLIKRKIINNEDEPKLIYKSILNHKFS
jgi:exosortase